MPKNKKGPHIAKKGQPTNDISMTKTLNENHSIEELQEIEDKYTEGEDIPASNVKIQHPNRNLNKPQIDKPAYS